MSGDTWPVNEQQPSEQQSDKSDTYSSQFLNKLLFEYVVIFSYINVLNTMRISMDLL